MGSSNQNTFAATPPRRPGLDDLGGAAKVNRRLPPDAARDLRAEDWNQNAQQVVGVAGIVPVVILTVHYTGGVHTIDRFVSLLPNLTPSAFSLTQDSAGVVTLNYADGLLPVLVADVKATPLGQTPVAMTCETLAHGARVRSSVGSTPTHSGFLLEIF
ncbi:MAG: hypothetical protein EOO74_00680 [Myxococcales bacterium]|nr:MAG: hypothetical protein EOO74_00680 [Myxococcales bacterium]